MVQRFLCVPLELSVALKPLRFNCTYRSFGWKCIILLTCFFSPTPLPPPSRPRSHYRGFTIILRHTHTWWGSSGRVISSSQRPLPENAQHSQETDTHNNGKGGFEPAITESERPQTHSLDRAATGIGITLLILCKIYKQGVTGGMCETSGECSLGQTIPI